MNAAPASVQVRRGGLYLSSATCDRYFAGLESVILLRRDDDLVILPVRHAASGGYLLKRRNGAGDRVVFAPDFFREHGIDDETVREFFAHWEPEQAALVAKDMFL
ncbi:MULTISPECIES: hypothetical protein [Mesorhizobium]|uniref:Uncharacterized protein n=1 Tax=Mesorhizobium qingshengii TaxID=1165689 RepID=A0A1G5ZX96_9HYPH|nr:MULTISPECIES: hypothetical protein [Mesorhizobium]AID34935.1 hypothetical protein MCHK_8355 [Mesorhizobium huakuii 7653R]MCH4560574.1 hypothetical protein [Mesorhizobium jarvisii]SDA98903.1 hypothetical protein SAMN02927914_06385 [Mesorhizobium qingshengii]